MKEILAVLYLERIYAQLGCALHCIRRESKDLPINNGTQLSEIHAMIVEATQALSVAQSMLRRVINERSENAGFFEDP